MTTLKHLPWSPAPQPSPWTTPARRAAAATLISASAVLARLARRLSVPTVAKPGPLPSTLEFYASAGAPEGALYLDGELVGWLEGVKRL